MQLAQQKRRWLPVPPTAIHLQLPLYLRFIVALMLGVAVIVSTMAVLTRFAPPLSNPFSDYDYIQPGQPGSVLALHGFSCAAGRVTNDPPSHLSFTQYCVLDLDNGIFNRIGAMVSGNVVTQVIFNVREGTITAGDLALLWGKPPTIIYVQEQIMLAWERGERVILANTRGAGFSYFMFVRRVRFIAVS